LVVILIHADLCGQISPQTVGGKGYFLLVVDDFSRFMWIELLKTKDEALHFLKKIKQRAEVDQEGRLKGIRTDRGGEFNSNMFTAFCTEQGIKHFTTTPYSPQQNGVVERRNQTVVEMARCMMKSKGVPSRFWGEAVTTAVYLLNRSPTKSVQGRTPYEAWFGKKPSVQHLKTFGCIAHVKKIGPGVNKLSDRSTKMVLLGYESGTKGYRLFDPITEKLCISRDVVFEESERWDWESAEKNQQTETTIPFTTQFQFTVPDQTIQVPAGSGDTSESSGGAAASPPSPQTPMTPSVSQNQSQAASVASGSNNSSQSVNAGSSDMVPLRYRTISDLLDSTQEVHDFEYSAFCLLAADEPKNVESALTDQCWRQAMNLELDTIEQNHTWVWTDLPKE
jgi:hypothetical protein